MASEHRAPLAILVLLGVGWLSVAPAATGAEAPKPATDATRAANAALLRELPFSPASTSMPWPSSSSATAPFRS